MCHVMVSGSIILSNIYLSISVSVWPAVPDVRSVSAGRPALHDFNFNCKDNLPVETLFDHNNCTATIGDHIILHNYFTWALRCKEVKAPDVKHLVLYSMPHFKFASASVSGSHHWSLLPAVLHGPSLFPSRHGIWLSV